MNFSYFRNSTLNFEETIQKASDVIQKNNFKISGSEKIEDKIAIFYILKNEWIKKIIEIDSALISFLPNYLIIFKKENQVLVGSGRGTLLGNLAQNEEIFHLAQEIESNIKNLVNEIAGVGELKPKSIKLYTTTTCPYCKMEKAWLDAHQVSYQQVFVDLDQAAGEEMVRKTGQMGVPVTEIIYEDNEPDYIIGFDKPQLSQILGIKE